MAKFAEAGSLLAAVVLAGSLVATPAHAQIQSQQRQDTGDSEVGSTASWELTLAPAFGNDLAISDDRITNENAVSATVSLEHVFSSLTYLNVTAGGEANPAFASFIDLPGTAAIAQLIAGQRIGFGSADQPQDLLDLQGSYTFRSGHEDDEDPTTENDFTDHQLGAELSFKNIIFIRRQNSGEEWEEGPAVELTAGWARVKSNRDDREKNALTATADLTFPFRRVPDLNVQLGYERSRFDEPVDGIRRRDHQPSIFLGADFTDMLGWKALAGATVGISFAQNFSTIDQEDDKSAQLQFGIAFGGKRKIR